MDPLLPRLESIGSREPCVCPLVKGSFDPCTPIFDK